MSKKDKDGAVLSPKDIIKRYGDVLSTGKKVFEKKQTLRSQSVSPAFDLSLNGGLLEGTWVIISGNPKVGKSTLCLQICANGQKEGRKAIYVDAESRLKNYNLVGVKDLDLDAMEIIHTPEEGEQLAAEDFLNILENLIKSPEYSGAIAVIDSCSSLVPRAELDAEASASIRASLPKLLSSWIKKNAQNITKNKIILLIITHYITNTSGYGKHKVADGGVMVQYQADTRIDGDKVEEWKDGETKVGQIVTWSISCSSLGASGRSCTSYIRYGVGIDFTQEIIGIGEDLGLIDKAGSWYNCSFMIDQEGYNEKDYRFQGAAKLYDFISNNPQVFKVLEGKVKEMLQ